MAEPVDLHEHEPRRRLRWTMPERTRHAAHDVTVNRVFFVEGEERGGGRVRDRERQGRHETGAEAGVDAGQELGGQVKHGGVDDKREKTERENREGQRDQKQQGTKERVERAHQCNRQDARLPVIKMNAQRAKREQPQREHLHRPQDDDTPGDDQ